MITSQQLSRYYEQYGGEEVTFTREVSRILRLEPRHVYLKCQADSLPCLLYSSSLRGAKLIANLGPEARSLLERAVNALALRFCFAREGSGGSLAFFVPSRLAALTAYNREAPDLHFLSLEYTHRPPDDLIEILGGLLEASSNAQRRAEERVVINPASLRHLGLESRDAALVLQGAEGGQREGRCLLRDLSFSGAKLLVYGQEKDFAGRGVLLRLAFDDPPARLELAGRVLRWEGMANREDIGAVAVRFEGEVPMRYKLAVNAALRRGSA